MYNSQQFSCFIIGEGSLPIQCAQLLLERNHQILGMISLDRQVKQWAEQQHLPYILPDRGLIHSLKQQPFDYLFSIVNHALLSPEVLALPRQLAVNYHDSPLPKYAGLYASSWALMHQEKHHAVTWHVMSTGIDEGEILKQVSIEIVPDETALTLNTKDYEAAISAFAELIDELATHTATQTKQDFSDRSYFSRTKKPEMGMQFHWQRSAHELDALVRALNFAPFPNPLGLAKLAIAANGKQELVIISQLEVCSQQSNQLPGTITAIHANSLQVATITNDVALQKVLDLHGQTLPISELVAEFGLQVGDRLPDLELNLARRIDQLDSAFAKHEPFWIEQLGDLQPLTLQDSLPDSLPEKIAPQQPSSQKYAAVQIDLLEVAIAALKQSYGKQSYGDRQNDLVIAAFAVYLARLCGINCYDIGFSNAALQADLAGVEQFFATQVPCRISLHSEQNFEQFFHAVAEQMKQIKKRKTYSSDLVARYPKLTAKPELKHNSLFPVSIHQVERLDDRISSQFLSEFLSEEVCFNQLGNKLTLVISTDGKACLIYNTAILGSEQTTNIGSQFIAFLQDLITYPDRTLTDFPSCFNTPALTEAEQHRILKEWNATEVDYPRVLRLHDLFEAQAAQTPTATAAVFNEERLTYEALNRRANQLAHRLQALGVKPEMPVGICIERSIEMIVGLLAILKAGGAYVPLDPTYPQDRLAHILSDSQMSIVLTQEKLLPLLSDQPIPMLCLDMGWDAIAAESEENPVSLATAENLAYIIYTSGSTGKPKGVLIEHRGAVNTILDINARFQVTAQDRVLAVCSLNFDLSVYDVFGLLAAGGTIVIPQPAIAPDLNHWLDLMAQEQVTLWNSAPPVMQMFAGHLVDRDQALPASLRLVLLSGDWIPVSLPPLIRHLTGQEKTQIVSLGGATEASIWSILYSIAAIDPAWKSIPYGKPMANQQFYILDEQLKLVVPVGAIGELYIGGDGVARGYLNRPDLNATKFIPNPFSARLDRLYRTGDLGRYLPDGNIEFLGRIDHQVKIRGFRVELGEIETVLAQHSGVRETAILAQKDKFGNQQLVAYLVGDRANSDSLTEDVRSFLKEKLPSYMVPSAFVLLESLPLTPNGKLDRKALPAPKLTSSALHSDSQTSTAFAAPRNQIEQQLVQIWQDFLGVQPISIKDNFFELGGNSLVAVRLWAAIEKTFDRDLPLATLFQAPTIEQIGDRLRPSHLGNHDTSRSCPSLVVIQPGQPQAKPPLFCIHVLGRGLKFYRPLASRLDSQQPIYGLSTHIVTEPFSSNQSEELAAHYIKQIRIIQPEGPYLLAGVSFGGLVAYEMAQQLLAQGQKVALLALLDSRLSGSERAASKSEKLAEYWRQTSDAGLSYVLQKSKAYIVGRLQNLNDWQYQLSSRLRIKLFEAIGQPLPEALEDFVYEQQNLEATEVYVPQVYAGAITFFKATEQSIGVESRLEPELGWSQFAAGGLTVYKIPGTHLGMLQEPGVEVLGRKMQVCIAKATAKEVSPNLIPPASVLICDTFSSSRMAERYYL